MNDRSRGRLVSPAAERNKQPIAEVLRQVLPERGLVLEIASGSGQHVLHFAGAMPHLTWQPSDRDAPSLASIADRLAGAPSRNVHAPVRLDVHDWPWPVGAADAVVAINMIHISPWSATLALLRGASAVLATGQPLCLYGPFRSNGLTAASNEAFDAQLRQQNVDWGLRDLTDVTAIARQAGFDLAETHEMPANNLTVIFRRRV